MRPQDILLLGLANVLDIAEEFKDPLGFVGKSYKKMYGWIPSQYKKHNFSHLVWRNLKTGYVEKVIKDGIPYLRLTSQGRDRIKRDFPLFAIQKRKWDRKWRLVIFDIEEASKKIREKFRYKLREVGFGMLQKSVFISPYDIAKDFAEFIESQGLGNSAYVLEVSNIVAGDIRCLADKVWNLEKLNKEYERITQRIEENDLISIGDRRIKLNDLNKELKDKDIVREVWKEYLEILLRDPFLPKDLLPLDWKGEKTRELMKKVQRAVEGNII